MAWAAGSGGATGAEVRIQRGDSRERRPMPRNQAATASGPALEGAAFVVLRGSAAIAAAITWPAGPESDWNTGAILPVDGSLSRVRPVDRA